jgi:hypothetical protein
MRYLVLPLLLLCSSCIRGEAATQRDFQQTGIIEGFYGPAWSHQDRLDMLRFMGRVGFSHYYYAPKDDPFHREQWYEHYPDNALAQLAELAAVAEESGVTFVYAISPGATIVYASPTDYERLRQKLRTIEALGVKDFALFLDDVAPNLQHSADIEAFASLAEAQASVINRLHRDLMTTGASLAVTPTTYTSAWGDRDYLQRLGDLVAAEVPFFWTGIDVASPTITTSQASQWVALISRRLLIWDNYPVNDYARWRPFLGPVGGRAGDLPEHALGILANPMNEAHASMIPLATVAAYAADPYNYDSVAVRQRTLVQLYGREVATMLEPFVTIYGDYGWEVNLFEPLFIPGTPIDVETMHAGVQQLRTSLDQLDSAARFEPTLGRLADDLRPFVSRTASRIEMFESDRRYARVRGRLVFRTELDRITAVPDQSVSLDGDLAEWSTANWVTLQGGEAPHPRVAFRTDTSLLYLALEVPHLPHTVRNSPSIGEGDHAAIVLQDDSDETRQYLTPRDAIVLVSPPTAETTASALVQSMAFHGFMAKWLADNQGLRFSGFHVSTFGSGSSLTRSIDAVGQLRSGGYVLEIQVPRRGRDLVRLSLTVTATVSGRRQTYSLAQRNYPANPATFATVVLTEGTCP